MSILNIQALRDAQEALKESGVIPSSREGMSKKEILEDSLERNQLGLDSVVRNIATLARGAEKDELRYKANELALKLHGALKDDESVAPVINVQIVGENVNLAFLKPTPL